jgi:hypothetical protein
MEVYIGYRNLKSYIDLNYGAGGNPVNNDQRLTSVKDGLYLLEFSGMHYAVSKERAERFIDEVISGSTGKHKGSFPMSINMMHERENVAVVEIYEGYDRYHYDFDEDVLLQMLEALKNESGEPMDRRKLINYCYPNPVLPEGDFELKDITYQKYFVDNTPISVIHATPDHQTSYYWVNDDGAHVQIREDRIKNRYDVPAELIPEIKARVRELCKEPAEAYVESGHWEAYIKFDDEDDRLFTDPDKTIAILKDIASRSVFKEKEEVKRDPMEVCPGDNQNFMGFMGMSMFQQQMQSATASPSSNATVNTAPAQVNTAATVSSTAQKSLGEILTETWECMCCGEKNNKGKFCINCGSPNTSEWVCPKCMMTNKFGKFCSSCGTQRMPNGFMG